MNLTIVVRIHATQLPFLGGCTKNSCPIDSLSVKLTLNKMLDHELLNAYVETSSQEAFAGIVSMHIDAVYSAARRQVRDPQLAQDVTQAVFIVLARRAKSLAGKGPLLGWLIKTTHFASMDALKREMRRRKYEREAANMKGITSEQDYAAFANEQLSPELDRALARLGDMDRCLISLRYLENRSILEVAQAVGLSGEATAKRISRALTKLRARLVKRDVIPAVAPVGALLEHLVREAAPEMLNKAVAASAGSVGASSSSVVAISKGVISMILWKKAAIATAALAAILLAGGIGLETVSKLHSGLERPVAAVAPMAAAAPAADPAGPFVVILNNGISLEIIGLCDHPSAGKQWWHPNGAPLDVAPYHHVMARMSSFMDGSIARELAVRLNKLPQGARAASNVSWGLVDTTASGGGPAYDGARAIIEGIEGWAVVVPNSNKGAVLRADIASGPWNTLGEIVAKVGQSSSMGAAEYAITDLVNRGGNTRVNYAQTRAQPGLVNIQWIAIDSEGREHGVQQRSMQSDPTGITGEFDVQVPIESLAKLVLQYRPYDQWIEIRNISLHLGQITNIEVVTSDDPAPSTTQPK